MPRRVSVAVFMLASAAGCAALLPAAEHEPPQAVCQLRDPRLTEVSGIAASRRHPGCYYVHNDSGGQPRVFLIDRQGSTRLEIRLRRAGAIDYEDIALAPGGESGTCDVCVADIGDNTARRSHVTIYRFPEVALPEQAVTKLEVEPTAYAVTYTDGPADAEAFCVHPRTGDGYVFTKRFDGRSVVYRLPAPWNAADRTALSPTMTLELRAAPQLARVVTAADISPDGRRLAVRCYLDGWEWRVGADASNVDVQGLLSARPVQLTLAPEPQGEALGYSANGQALLTLSEGRAPILYESPVPAQSTPHP